MSSKRATEWETPPPTPQMPAASAGAAAVAVPGKEKHSTESHTAGLELGKMWTKASILSGEGGGRPHTDLYTDDLSPLINYIFLNFTGS